jgi:hypothetical protein
MKTLAKMTLEMRSDEADVCKVEQSFVHRVLRSWHEMA